MRHEARGSTPGLPMQTGSSQKRFGVGSVGLTKSVGMGCKYLSS